MIPEAERLEAMLRMLMDADLYGCKPMIKARLHHQDVAATPADLEAFIDLPHTYEPGMSEPQVDAVPDHAPQQQQDQQHRDHPGDLDHGRRQAHAELLEHPDHQPHQADDHGNVDQQRQDGFHHGR